jgi:DeoR family fructose operon transcriptional repressor
MHNREREQQILNILNSTNGFVSTKQLCDMLFASESSIRRDLSELEKRNLVKRSYGGVLPATTFSNIVTFNQRTKQNVDQKREIAKKAASMIKEGQIIFLDQSSTAFYLADELVNHRGITVVTNNIEIMMLFSQPSSSAKCL